MEFYIMFMFLTGTWILYVCLFLEWHWSGSGIYPYALKNKLYKKYLKHTTQLGFSLNEANAYLILAFVYEIFYRQGIPFWLSEGTALGFRRDNGFISHDDDIDIGIWMHDAPLLVHAIDALKKIGFVIAESKRNGTFISLIWKELILDIDVTGPGKICTANFGPCDELIPHLQYFERIYIFDKYFFIPQDSYFEYLYGKDWVIPITNKKPERKAPWWRFV